MSRTALARVHRTAGILAFLTIVTFWLTTATVELLGTHAAVASAKGAILWGMAVLIPAMIAAGATGLRLGGTSRAPVITAKRRRMPVIALLGLLVLVPSAVFLAARSAAGDFDGLFTAVQAVELAAGAVNIALLGLNIRDGLAMTRPRRMRALGTA